MSLLPVEDPDWRDDFKARIFLERSIIRKLIQWGFSDSAFEIYRTIEERFNDALNFPEDQSAAAAFRLPQNDRVQIGEALRERYLKTRQFPRRRGCKELLQRGLFTGFEELSAELIQLFEQRLQHKTRNLAANKAA
jgi:hypothetical protein